MALLNEAVLDDQFAKALAALQKDTAKILALVKNHKPQDFVKSQRTALTVVIDDLLEAQGQMTP